MFCARPPQAIQSPQSPQSPQYSWFRGQSLFSAFFAKKEIDDLTFSLFQSIIL